MRGDWFESINLQLFFDYMAEWLRRWTANPLGSARAGSNPVIVELLGDLAQLVEHSHSVREVIGSIPLISKKKLKTVWPSG